MAVSTIHTTLKFGTSKESLTKMCPITSYPDLIGVPEKIDTTNLDHTQETGIPGVKKLDNNEFEAYYTKEEYTALAANQNTQGYFELEFGENGEQGIFEWQGEYTVSILGGGINEARKMKIVVTPSTDIVMKAD